jgi:hypothetical protein
MRVRILTTCVFLLMTVVFLWLASLVGEGLAKAILLTVGASAGLILVFVGFLAVADVLSAISKPAADEAAPNTPPAAGTGTRPEGRTAGFAGPNRSPKRRRVA